MSENVKSAKPRYWMGDVNETDDFGIGMGDVFIDGKTKQGPWAMMTPSSFRMYGVGLGTGRGQKYQKQTDGKWLKVEG